MDNISVFIETYNETEKSKKFLEISKNLNLIVSTIAILIGLVSNLIVIVVFSIKKFRSNSSHVYLLCSAINDSLFLVLHLFEDILRTFKFTYFLQNNHIINMLNISENSNISCQLTQYIRNILRFISAYIVVAIILQRLHVVLKPLSMKFKTKRSAWNTLSIIACFSIILNIWVPFMFEINKDEYNNKYCDINKNYKTVYFIGNIIYVCFIMLIPMIINLISNFIIIIKMIKNKTKRKSLQSIKIRTFKSAASKKKRFKRENYNSIKRQSSNRTRTGEQFQITSEHNSDDNSKNVKPHYWTIDQILTKRTKETSSTSLTTMSLIISFSFVITNMPYFIGWTVFFYKIAFENMNSTSQNYLFSILQLTEIFYVINYGLKFFIFCANGSMFRNKLKNIGVVTKSKRKSKIEYF